METTKMDTNEPKKDNTEIKVDEEKVDKKKMDDKQIDKKQYALLQDLMYHNVNYII